MLYGCSGESVLTRGMSLKSRRFTRGTMLATPRRRFFNEDNVMLQRWHKVVAVGLPAIALSMGMGSAAKADYLPGLTNLDFTQYTGSAPKGPFTSVNPVGWTGGNGLIYIDSTVPGHDA